MTNGKIIKVCGMQEGTNIRDVELLGADLIGFIFYPRSPRCIYELPDYLPQQAKRTGVFVNQEKDYINMIADRFTLNYIQLHGNESPGYCGLLKDQGLRLIKAFAVETPRDLEATQAYDGLCDYYLFDTKSEQHGGSGNQFDWNILHKYKGKTPFLLSGGINPFSIRALKEFRHPALAGYDINSRFETAPGKKNIEKITQFLNELNK